MNLLISALLFWAAKSQAADAPTGFVPIAQFNELKTQLQILQMAFKGMMEAREREPTVALKPTVKRAHRKYPDLTLEYTAKYTPTERRQLTAAQLLEHDRLRSQLNRRRAALTRTYKQDHGITDDDENNNDD